MNGKLTSARIISKTDADMYMSFSISYDICKYCDYIISWNTVSAFCSIYATQFFVNFVIYLMHVDVIQIVLRTCLHRIKNAVKEYENVKK